MDWLSPIRALFELIRPLLDSLPVIRAILGFVLVFLLPGFAWTLVFFRGHQISIIQRLALSFGLSIAVVTLSILVLNRVIGVRITGFNSVLIIGTITIIPVMFYWLRRTIDRRGGNAA